MPICNGRVLTCTCTVSVCTMYIVQYSSQARRHSLIHPYWPLQKFFTHFWTYCSLQALIKEGFIQKTRQRSSLLFRGYNLFNSLPRLLFSTRTIRRQGWIHHFIHIILVQLILFCLSSWCKTASAAWNWINSVPQTTYTVCILYDTV